MALQKIFGYCSLDAGVTIKPEQSAITVARLSIY